MVYKNAILADEIFRLAGWTVDHHHQRKGMRYSHRSTAVTCGDSARALSASTAYSLQSTTTCTTERRLHVNWYRTLSMHFTRTTTYTVLCRGYDVANI